MNNKDKQLTLEILNQILQDNLNNRITFAVSNGILQQLSAELSRYVSQAEMPHTAENPISNTTETE